LYLLESFKLGEVAHTCNPNTQEPEAGGFQVPDQPGLYLETLSQKQTNKIEYRDFFKNHIHGPKCAT
jgi:hypothetical protein